MLKEETDSFNYSDFHSISYEQNRHIYLIQTPLRFEKTLHTKSRSASAKLKITSSTITILFLDPVIFSI